MADKVQFELVSPEKLIASAPVDMVVVPGGDGDFGVLAGHTPMITTVRPGIIAIYENEVVTQRIFVAGGFAEVTAERCTVLAEDASAVGDIDAAAAEQALRDRIEDLQDAKDDAQRQAAEKRVAAAQARVDAAQAG